MTVHPLKNISRSRKLMLALEVTLLLGVLWFALKPFSSHQRHETLASSRMDFSDDIHPQKTAQAEAGTKGEINTDDFDPQTYLTSWNYNHLPREQRERYYRETDRPNGTKLREYWITAEEKTIEVAPNVFFPAWTYNGQVPGPTIRATEGDLVRIYFKNNSTRPHTMHFHGYHTAEMDGSMTHDFVYSGEEFTYEFTAEPFGVHLYHCHSFPVSEHIHKGLYGLYIVDPREDSRPRADQELMMVLNGFDTNFDEENEVYGVNTVAFAYKNRPIVVKKGQLVRLYVANLVEFDPMNSFHLHANFFDHYPTGTSLKPVEFTDTITLGQGERSVFDVRFREKGRFMFHAHKTEFTEKGWMGNFLVEE